MSLRRIFLVSLMLAALSSSAFAQSTATLQGTVTDHSGAVVSGAKVTVRNQATGSERIVQTDSNGNYQAAALPPGVYQVEAQAQGFGPQAVNDLTLEVSRIVVQNFQLKVGDVTQRSRCDRRHADRRDVHDHRRPGNQSEDRPGDSAQWPPLRRSRTADPRLGHSAAERFPDRAAARARLVRVQHRGRSRRHRQLHDQRHQPERHGSEPDHFPAVDQHRAGVQSR